MEDSVGKVVFYTIKDILQRELVTQISFVTTAEKDSWDFTDDTTQQIDATLLDGDVEPIMILHQQKLGIVMWCLKDLYTFSSSLLQSTVKQEDWLEDQDKKQIVLDASRALLIVTAYHGTALNYRRKITLAEATEEKISSEIDFINLCLSKHPKSAEIWAYRKWLLDTFPQSIMGTAEKFDREIQQCTLVAEQYPRNYYAWTYQILVYEKSNLSPQQIIKQISSTSTSWIRKHVSDHSGFHCRQFLLLQFLKTSELPDWKEFVRSKGASHVTNFVEWNEGSQMQFKTVMDFWIKEMCLIRNLMLFYPGHEAMWYHRRMVFSMWVLIIKFAVLSGAPIKNPDITRSDQNSDDDDDDDELWPTVRGELNFTSELIVETTNARSKQHRNSACAYRIWVLYLQQIIIGNDNSPYELLLGTVDDFDNSWKESMSLVERYSWHVVGLKALEQSFFEQLERVS